MPSFASFFKVDNCLFARLHHSSFYKLSSYSVCYATAFPTKYLHQLLQWWPIEMRWQKRLLLCTTNHGHYENKRGTIKKSYKNATRNAKKEFNFPKIVGHWGLFRKIWVFGKWAWQASNGSHAYPLDLHFQCISMRKPSWKFHSKIFTGFKFEKTTFSKEALKTHKFWQI